MVASNETTAPLPAACPRCGKPMSEGYVATAYRLNWVDHLGLMDASVFKGEPLVGAADTLGGTAHVHSRRCTECKIVLMDYGERLHYWSD